MPFGTPLLATDKTVGILIYPDVEVLDFCGPYEVFSTARLHEDMRRETNSPVRLLLVSETAQPVEASGGMLIVPNVDFASCPRLDLLLIPGGHGTRALMHRPEYTNWLKQQALQVERLASIATGSLLLGEAGLLTGKSATTHWRSVDFFRERFPRTTLLQELPIVTDGNIVTASSIRAGIDMAFRMVAQYYGQNVAREAARQMEYPFPAESAAPATEEQGTDND